MSTPLMWRRIRNPQAPPGSECWKHITKPLLAIVSRDPVAGELRWHLSVSHGDRVPSWGELGEARDALLPEELHFMVPHPPRRYWMNLNRRVLHLWEMRDPELAQQFEWEGEGARRAGFNEPDSGDPTAS